MISLSRLFIHPVKSMRGMQLSHGQALESGLAFDRAFMLTQTDGTFITARQYPEIVLFTPSLIMGGLHLTAPDGSSATIMLHDFHTEDRPTEVWGNHFHARVAPDSINRWLSDFFPHPVELRWVGPEMSRRVKRFQQVPLGFADGYPYLLVNEASLRDLQRRCPAGVKMEQFRPNLVVSGAAAWEEDGWSSIRVGGVVFDIAKPCSRCIFTTVSPEGGKKHRDGEPLATLQAFRTAQDKDDIDFGMNLIARSSGVVRVGDTVEILERRPPRRYGGGVSNASLPVQENAPREVVLEWQGTVFRGDNQRVILEQLEAQGVRIPYSCRAGICGNCKVSLVSGEVVALKKGAIGDDGTILSCSCIPADDLVLR